MKDGRQSPSFYLFIHFGFALALQHIQCIQGKRFHFVFTWKDMDWGQEFYSSA